MSKYIATVQLVVQGTSVDDAEDTVETLLTHIGMEETNLKDWNYLRVGDQRLTPTRDYGRHATPPLEAFRLLQSEPVSRVLHRSRAAELLLHKVLSAVSQVQDDITGDNGGSFSCFITGYSPGNEICQKADSPVCKLCQRLQYEKDDIL